MSRRNSREGKARRRAERETECSHLVPGENLTLCRHPGCLNRWTLDIQLIDGYAAFLCETHGMPAIRELSGQGLLKSITSSDMDLWPDSAEASYPQWQRGQAL